MDLVHGLVACFSRMTWQQVVIQHACLVFKEVNQPAVRVGPERFKRIIIIKLKSIVLYVPALPRVKSDTEKEVVWMDYKQVTTAR